VAGGELGRKLPLTPHKTSNLGRASRKQTHLLHSHQNTVTCHLLVCRPQLHGVVLPTQVLHLIRTRNAHGHHLTSDDENRPQRRLRARPIPMRRQHARRLSLYPCEQHRGTMHHLQVSRLRSPALQSCRQCKECLAQRALLMYSELAISIQTSTGMT
jgi:hypothetical protein